MRACRDGVIDFAEARINDPKWWMRANILIDSMAREDDLEIVKGAMAFHLALLSNPQLTEDSWNASKKQALELYNEILGIVHPWEAKSTEQRKSEEIDGYREMYKQMIGDPDDPEFASRLQAEVDRMLADAAVEEESEEDRVARLFAERTQRQGR